MKTALDRSTDWVDRLWSDWWFVRLKSKLM
jgi:hypothetical protein